MANISYLQLSLKAIHFLKIQYNVAVNGGQLCTESQIFRSFVKESYIQLHPKTCGLMSSISCHHSKCLLSAAPSVVRYLSFHRFSPAHPAGRNLSQHHQAKAGYTHWTSPPAIAAITLRGKQPSPPSQPINLTLSLPEETLSHFCLMFVYDRRQLSSPHLSVNSRSAQQTSKQATCQSSWTPGWCLWTSSVNTCPTTPHSGRSPETDSDWVSACQGGW